MGKKKEEASTIYADRLSFSSLASDCFGLNLGDKSVYTDFIVNFSNYNSASFTGGGLKPSIINTQELENIFFLSAIENSIADGEIKYLSGTKFKESVKKKDYFYIKATLLDFFSEYIQEDLGKKIPLVIDANKSLFKSKHDGLWDDFCYLLSYEGIADPSPKKNPLKPNTLLPFTKNFYVQSKIHKLRT